MTYQTQAGLSAETAKGGRARVCYLILAHCFPRQVDALVSHFCAQTANPIFLHVDRKARRQFRDLRDKFSGSNQVAFASLGAARWGGYSLVEITIASLKEAFRIFPDVSHVKLLSGQDFPARPLKEFEAFVRKSGDKSIIDYTPLPRADLAHGGGLHRVVYPHIVFAKDRFLRLPLRIHVPSGTTIYHGSQFWCISRTQFSALLPKIEKYRSLFRWSLIPDEMYFQTILKDLFDEQDLINLELTYTQWGPQGQGPRMLSEVDLENARTLGYYFARKYKIPDA